MTDTATHAPVLRPPVLREAPPPQSEGHVLMSPVVSWPVGTPDVCLHEVAFARGECSWHQMLDTHTYTHTWFLLSAFLNSLIPFLPCDFNFTRPADYHVTMCSHGNGTSWKPLALISPLLLCLPFLWDLFLCFSVPLLILCTACFSDIFEPRGSLQKKEKKCSGNE